MQRLPTPLRKIVFHVVAPKVSLGASAVIWDAQGRVLLVHHTYRNPDWGFPSGLVGRHEQPAAALSRELHEELGVAATIERLLHAEVDAPIRHLTLFYAATLLGAPQHRGPEIDGLLYAAVSELETLVGDPPASWLVQALERRS
jgi:8-oxo-dGTP pyrophosphatase MutT (NUDIX family)